MYDFVIIGGGAGGLELAARLGRRLGRRAGPKRVLLIDRSITHLWKPSLHEVAAGTLDVAQEAFPYPLLARRNHFSFKLGNFVGLDAANKRISLSSALDTSGDAAREVAYGTLVLATGSGSNFFNTPGALEHAHVLESGDDARRFHTRLIRLFLGAAYGDRPEISLAIVGAGATGTELAAEILAGKEEFASGLASEYQFDLTVTLVEAAERILGGLSPRVSASVQQELQERGVRVLTGARVLAVGPDGLETTAGQIAADAVVWAAGVLASPLNTALGLQTGRLNQIVVDGFLRTSEPDIHAIGDCAWNAEQPSPPTAQAAAQQARFLSQYLLKGGTRPFRYHNRGALVSVGHSAAFGSLMGGLLGKGFILEGLIARAVYAGIRFDHYRSVVGFRRTFLMGLARLFAKRASGRLKLH